MPKILWVGLGGALGSVMWYLLSFIPIKGSFPVVMLTIKGVLIDAVVCAASHGFL